MGQLVTELLVLETLLGPPTDSHLDPMMEPTSTRETSTTAHSETTKETAMDSHSDPMMEPTSTMDSSTTAHSVTT